MNAASKLLRNLGGLARRPALGAEYLGWLLSGARHGGHPTRRLLDGIEIGGFANFSEYHSVARFISAAERRFFETVPVGPGALIDVGANLGLVSLLLAHRFADRDIHAFEPNPTTFAALERNVARARAERVRCHRLAVSDVEGSVLFDADPVKRGTASLAIDASGHGESVSATTLDRFVASRGIDAVGLLKIDVEGFETLVLRGASRMLREVRPALIYFEVCPALTERAGFPASEPARLLAAAGYDLTRLDEHGAQVPVTPETCAGVALENWIATAR